MRNHPTSVKIVEYYKSIGHDPCSYPVITVNIPTHSNNFIFYKVVLVNCRTMFIHLPNDLAKDVTIPEM